MLSMENWSLAGNVLDKLLCLPWSAKLHVRPYMTSQLSVLHSKCAIEQFPVFKYLWKPTSLLFYCNRVPNCPWIPNSWFPVQSIWKLQVSLDIWISFSLFIFVVEFPLAGGDQLILSVVVFYFPVSSALVTRHLYCKLHSVENYRPRSTQENRQANCIKFSWHVPQFICCQMQPSLSMNSKYFNGNILKA